MGQLLRGTTCHPNESYSEYQEPTTYTISASEYAQHLKNELILQALMVSGVHQWEGFEVAMAAVKDCDE